MEVALHCFRVDGLDVHLLTELLHGILQVGQCLGLWQWDEQTHKHIHITMVGMLPLLRLTYIYVCKGDIMDSGDWVNRDVVEVVEIVLGRCRILRRKSE